MPNKPQPAAPPRPLPSGASAPIPPKAILLLHGTLLLYAVVSLFGKYAGVNLAAGQTAPTLLFVGLEFAALWCMPPCGSKRSSACR